MNDVRITVLMPCYNAASYIAEAIQSVLLQTFIDFELLIINDGSIDDTADIVRSFADKRIVFIEQEQQGVAAALNNGLRHARAPFIARFDADDICFPTRLEKQYQFMMDHPECILVGSAADYMDQSGNYIFTHLPVAESPSGIIALPYTVCPFIHASVMYKKEVVANIGYRVAAHSFEDHLLWQQLKLHGAMYNLSESLLSVRLNPASFTMDERKRPAAFHRIKNNALKCGNISSADGEILRMLIQSQNNVKTKEGAYHSLLAKKFLWNNYNPSKARLNIKKAISLNVFDIKDYMLLMASYLPKNMITNLYTLFVFAR